MTASTIDMDYNFLQSVQKIRQVGEAVVKPNEAVYSRRKFKLQDRDRAILRAMEDGVGIRELPKGMEKREKNRIKWDAKYVCA